MLYSTSKGSSSGKIGPFIGRVTQVRHMGRSTIARKPRAAPWVMLSHDAGLVAAFLTAYHWNLSVATLQCSLRKAGA